MANKNHKYPIFLMLMLTNFSQIKSLSLLILAICVAVFSSSCGLEKSATNAAVTENSLLNTVKKRGYLKCGVSGKLPGFSFVNEKGEYSGMDVDLCRAVAAALFDDPDKVEYRNLSSADRFTAVQSGEVDLLSRNTTWTISRNTSIGMEFAPTIFYDGQGVMVSSKSGIKKLEQLQGKTICVKSGTTTEQNLADRMNQKGIDYNPVVFGDEDTLFNSYLQGRCEAITADRTQLVGRRVIFSNPEEHVILPIVMSKEPLSPVVATGDSKWFNSVKWITYALIQAEEYGINSSNLGTFETTNDPSIKRFLGTEGSLGEKMGLPNDFATRVVKHVGNYGEVYERNIGEPLNLDRGQNALWTDGGLLYSPPFR